MGYYGIPTIDKTMVKVSFSSKNEPVNSINTLQHYDPTEDIQQAREIIRRDLPGLYDTPNRVQIYMEGYTTDKHPIIGKVPGKENVIVGGGFSGHGFKMAPAIGNMLANFTTDEKQTFDVQPFCPSRFQAK